MAEKKAEQPISSARIITSPKELSIIFLCAEAFAFGTTPFLDKKYNNCYIRIILNSISLLAIKSNSKMGNKSLISLILTKSAK